MHRLISVLSVILLLSSCIGKTTITSDTNGEPVNEITLPVLEDNNDEVTAERAAPLIIGGKYFNSYTLEEAGLLQDIILSIDPNDRLKMHSLENLELLTNLKILRIRESNLNSVDLSPLAFLTNLEILFISDTKFGSVDLSPLAFLINLRRFDIYDATDLASVDFTFISSLFNLESFFIDGDISNMPDLTPLKKLKSITIENSVLESLDGLGAPNIERLYINMETFETLSPLSNMTELKLLELVTQKTGSFASIGNPYNIPHLEFLTIQIDGQLDVTGIERLTSLAHVLFGTYTDLVNPQGISGLHNLKTLTITLADENPSIEYLGGLQNLEKLDIQGDSFWRYGRGEPYQILDVSPLANNNNLRLLRMRYLIIKNISALDNLKNLEFDGGDQIDLIDSRLFDETEKSVHGLVLQSYGH